MSAMRYEMTDSYYSGERYGVVRTVDGAYVVTDRQTGNRETAPGGRNSAHRIARRKNREARA